MFGEILLAEFLLLYNALNEDKTGGKYTPNTIVGSISKSKFIETENFILILKNVFANSFMKLY